MAIAAQNAKSVKDILDRLSLIWPVSKFAWVQDQKVRKFVVIVIENERTGILCLRLSCCEGNFGDVPIYCLLCQGQSRFSGGAWCPAISTLPRPRNREQFARTGNSFLCVSCLHGAK